MIEESQINHRHTLVLRENAEMLLQQGVGHPNVQFRPGQWEAIDALVNHSRRVLVLERTGWGKSLVYFISTRILRDQGRGLTLVVSPLLALMRNQMDAAIRIGLNAFTMNSTNVDEWDDIESKAQKNQLDLLLVSPERFANERFLKNLLQIVSSRIGLLVIDEAHCISDWGHDFRPDYRRIVGLLKQLPPNVPVVGTTATANDRVIEDIQHQLGSIHVHRGTLTRESLKLRAMVLPDQATRMAWLAEQIPKFSGTGIVYVLTKRDSIVLEKWLRTKGFDARAYFSSVQSENFDTSDEYRQHLESLLLDNKIKALIATSALGMGYDKPDIAFVIHYQSPSSVITYYQQVGRAGRAIPQAFGVLLSGKEDSDIIEFFRKNAFPTEEMVNQLLEYLSSRDGASVPEIEKDLNLQRGKVNKVFKYLSVQIPSPIIKVGSKWYRTALEFKLDKSIIEHLTSQREIEWNQIQEYINTSGCRMAFLQKALNDSNVKNCKKCDNCLNQSLDVDEYSKSVVIQAKKFLQQIEFPIEARKLIPKDACPTYGFQGRISSDLMASEGRVLSRWADDGWGSMVRDGKISGHFTDDLVEAVADMILNRWKPSPFPKWMTYVPSARNPDLVRSYSRRLAEKLGLPFLEVLIATGKSKPQKEQQNSFHQCHNLDDAFELIVPILQEPVFLVDDIVDSGWTFTIASVLIRQAGSREVYPIALASTANT
ncbi:MAG: RecQ family ATP-dependent DNA helicase [Flavobacteriaceae bacterium]|nr:RecQ family ATP-dependent DNA helicase [Flavobacteriaceae bacterium]MCY4266908.1 RecQ family ATP-dependent DNA helicase [Flavobacteriaceae bacterium]